MSFLSTYKIPQPRGYADKTYYIEDRSETSPNYFDIVDFPLVVGGGRYVFKLKANGINMRINSTIDLEIIDSEGQRIYCEVVDFSDRFNTYYISVDIYDITAQGLATAYFVGEAIADLNGNPIPEQFRDEYNVRWVKAFNVLPYERNNADLIFDEPPLVSLAQVIVPARQQSQTTSSADTFTTLTSSVNLLNIVSTTVEGYDRDFASSVDILDPRIRNIQVNPTNDPTTTNSVPTAIRQDDYDIENGKLINFTTRFNTILQASQSFFSKQYLGAYFKFHNSQSIPTNLNPNVPDGTSISSSIYTQLGSYYSTIVEVINDKQVILSKPLSIVTIDNNVVGKGGFSTHKYKTASQFTGSITYVPTDDTFITSSTVSESYVEFTFNDINPIGGEVYRIKTHIKLGSVTGDYKLLNDQIVTPVEYLTDAAFPNAVNYGRHESEYLLIGHFFTQSVLDTYWTVYEEQQGGFDPVSGSVTANILIDSARLPAAYTQSYVLTSTYQQNYNIDQFYTLGFYLTLDPYTEVEVYMASDPLNAYLVVPATYPKAFDKSTNPEKESYPGSLNLYGKYVGKVSNNRASRKYYGKILFDFQTDGSGLGYPAVRSRIINRAIGVTGSAYVSEISIKPYRINGFTPNIVQYAVPLPQEFVNAAAVTQSMDFKIEYFDYTGRQSEYVTYLDDVVLNLKAEIPSNTCQTDKLSFSVNTRGTAAPTE